MDGFMSVSAGATIYEEDLQSCLTSQVLQAPLFLFPKTPVPLANILVKSNESKGPSSPSSPSSLGGSIVSAMSSAELFLQVRITSPAEKTMPAIEMVPAKSLYKSAKRLTFFTCGVSRCWPWPCALPRHWMLKS